MATLAEIYNWFMTGKKPTQAQFWAAWGSFWNKNESIPQSSISGLTGVLNAKVENDQFNAHKGANDAHAALFQAKEDKTQKGAPNGYAPLDEFTKLAAQYLNIVNDLVTGGATALLSAEQGKILQTQVNAINTLLTSDNVNLDTVQELVDAIETVQLSLSSILVNDLTTGGTTKALTAEMGKNLKGLIDGLLSQVTPAPIYKIGQLCIFKNPSNESNNDYLEPGDTVIGFVEGEFLNSGTYYGGDPMLLSSYTEPSGEIQIVGNVINIDSETGDVTFNLIPEVLARVEWEETITFLFSFDNGDSWVEGYEPIQGYPVTPYGSYGPLGIRDLRGEFQDYLPEILEPYYNFEMNYYNPYSSDLVVLTRYNPATEDFKTFSGFERAVINDSPFGIRLDADLSNGSYDTYVKLERYDGAEWSIEYETTQEYSVSFSSVIDFNQSEKIRFTIQIRETQYPV